MSEQVYQLPDELEGVDLKKDSYFFIRRENQGTIKDFLESQDIPCSIRDYGDEMFIPISIGTTEVDWSEHDRIVDLAKKASKIMWEQSVEIEIDQETRDKLSGIRKKLRKALSIEDEDPSGHALMMEDED